MIEATFGEWLKSQRRILGWTQKELALKLHCSLSTLRKIESEERHPSQQLVGRLAEIFNIPATQRRSLLLFARGDWLAVSQEMNLTSPWTTSHTSKLKNPPAQMTAFIGREEVDGLLKLASESPDAMERLILLRQAYELAESLGDVPRQISALWQLGWSDNANRFGYWEKAIEHTRAVGTTEELANKLSTAGFFFVLNGDIKTAQKYLDESSVLYQQMNMKPAAVHLLSAQGQISLLRGDFDKARLYLLEHARIALEYGSRVDYLWSQVRLGYVALRAGALVEARKIFLESAWNFKKEKLIIGVVFTLEGIAGLCIQTGKPKTALNLIGWADTTRTEINDKRPRLEQADIDEIIDACITKIGEVAFSEAYNLGKTMSLDEAVALALEEN